MIKWIWTSRLSVKTSLSLHLARVRLLVHQRLQRPVLLSGWGLAFVVWDSVSEGCDLAFGVYGLGFGVWCLLFRVWGLGLEFRVEGLEFQV